MLRIAKENVNMLKRITNKRPAISIDKLEKDWKQNLQFMDNISAFPDEVLASKKSTDWWLHLKWLDTEREHENATNTKSFK